MALVQRTEVFDIHIEKFYSAIVDYRGLPEFVDWIKDINVIEESAEHAKVEYFVDMVKKTKYTIELTHRKPNHVSWTLVEGELFKKNEGSWELKDLGNGKTEVTYSLDIDFTGFAPKMVIQKLAASNLPELLESYYKRASSI